MSDFRKLIKEVDSAGTWEVAGDEIPLRVINALEDAEEIIDDLEHRAERAEGLVREIAQTLRELARNSDVPMPVRHRARALLEKIEEGA